MVYCASTILTTIICDTIIDRTPIAWKAVVASRLAIAAGVQRIKEVSELHHGIVAGNDLPVREVQAVRDGEAQEENDAMDILEQLTEVVNIGRERIRVRIGGHAGEAIAQDWEHIVALQARVEELERINGTHVEEMRQLARNVDNMVARQMHERDILPAGVHEDENEQPAGARDTID